MKKLHKPKKSATNVKFYVAEDGGVIICCTQVK